MTLPLDDIEAKARAAKDVPARWELGSEMGYSVDDCGYYACTRPVPDEVSPKRSGTTCHVAVVTTATIV